MQIFSRLTIGSRLWLNLAIVLGFVALFTFSSWFVSHTSAKKAHARKLQQPQTHY